MFLDEISDTTILFETDKKGGFGHKLYFRYQKAKAMSSPDPIVLFLGVWRMTTKQGQRKKFLCGINLAALSDKEELSSLEYYLDDILRDDKGHLRPMKERYREGKRFLPSIFRKAYRTYNVKNVSSRPIFGRFYALKTTDQDKEMAQKSAEKDGLEWETLKQRRQEEYIANAIQKRGEEDIKRKESAKKERDSIHDYLAAQREKEKDVEPDAEISKEIEPEPEIELPKKTKESGLPSDSSPESLALRHGVSELWDAPPESREFTPIAPGPGIQYKPKPKPKPKALPSPIQNVATGMPTPKKIKIVKPAPKKGGETPPEEKHREVR